MTSCLMFCLQGQPYALQLHMTMILFFEQRINLSLTIAAEHKVYDMHKSTQPSVLLPCYKDMEIH